MISTKVSKWFRGLAILMVIASHYAGWMFVEPRCPQLREQVMTLGVYGVDIFFLMSGYGLVKSSAKNGIDRRFVWKRIAGSYLPYLIVVGTMMALDGDFHGKESVVKFLTGFDFWFMSNLFVFYLLFMIFRKIFGKLKAVGDLFLGASVIGYSVYLFSIGREDFWIVSNGAFLIGAYWADLEEPFKGFLEKRRNQLLLVLGSFLGMWYAYRQYMAAGEMTWENITSLFFSLFIMALCLLISGAGGKLGEYKFFRLLFSGKIMGTLGTYSLFIYLLHTRLFYLIIFHIEAYGYRFQTAVTGLITIGASLIVGKLLTWGIEKVTPA